jgi:hypothetical protein
VLSPESSQAANSLSPAIYPPAPSSVLGDDDDLLHEELSNTVAAAMAPMAPMAPMEAEGDASSVHEKNELFIPQPLSKVQDALIQEDAVLADDLQPGGVGSNIQHTVAPDTVAKGSVLDAMTLKELRRLAEQKGISGASNMRKQALIDALRANPPTPMLSATIAPFASMESTLDLS